MKFYKKSKKQAKQWKTDKKTGKQENVQKTGKNKKTGSVGILQVHYKMYSKTSCFVSIFEGLYD